MDSLHWIPKVNGQFRIPLVSMYTLGDLYVPFSMQQIYRQRANERGKSAFLVQRIIRAPSRCNFIVQELVEPFETMVTWEQTGVKPAGGDLRTTIRPPSPRTH